MSTQRKAWNEAMKKAARGTMLPIPGMPTNSRRSSSRNSRNKQRREKARKSLNFIDGDGNGDYLSGGEGGGGGGVGGGSGFIDLVEFRIDALEEACNEFGGGGGGLNGAIDDDDDEEYSEMEEYEESRGGKGGGAKRKKRGGKKKTKSKNTSASSAKNSDGQLPKRFKARSLASILIEESARGNEDGVLQDYLNAEAKPTKSTASRSSQQQQRRKRRYPRRKFCCVTGLEALYKDPKTGIPYANLTALEQIRERAPPWISGLGNTGSANYYEAVRSLRNEE